MSTHAKSVFGNANVPVSSDEFRAAMRQFASSVTIITTVNDNVPHGMTATAVCSVCAEPATVLVVVNRTTRSHPLIGAARSFTINLLSREQLELANRFSGKLADQFEGVDCFESPNTGSPVFEGVSSYLECELIDQVEMGTHTVFFGKVLYCGSSEDAPLLYHAGRYGEVVCLTSA